MALPNCPGIEKLSWLIDRRLTVYTQWASSLLASVPVSRSRKTVLATESLCIVMSPVLAAFVTAVNCVYYLLLKQLLSY